MSISSEVLADSPVLYWKLDDPTGPAASDSSGHGNTGFYGGAINLGVQGPETGTTCALLGLGGFVRTFAASPRQVVPWTFDVWIANANLQLSGTGGSTIFINGNGASSGAGLAWGFNTNLSNGILVFEPSVLTGSAVGTVNVASWTHIAARFDGASNFDEFINGVVVGSAAAIPYAPLAATDSFAIGSATPQQAYYAHAALYPTALTNARILAHAGSRSSTPPPVTPVGGTNSLDIAAIEADLNAILAAVRKTFPTT